MITKSSQWLPWDHSNFLHLATFFAFSLEQLALALTWTSYFRPWSRRWPHGFGFGLVLGLKCLTLFNSTVFWLFLSSCWLKIQPSNSPCCQNQLHLLEYHKKSEFSTLTSFPKANVGLWKVLQSGLQGQGQYQNN